MVKICDMTLGDKFVFDRENICIYHGFMGTMHVHRCV